VIFPLNLLSAQVDGSEKDSIAPIPIVKVILKGLAKMEGGQFAQINVVNGPWFCAILSPYD